MGMPLFLLKIKNILSKNGTSSQNGLKVGRQTYKLG